MVEQTQELVAGRDLDAEVDARVFGYSHGRELGHVYRLTPAADPRLWDVPHYSTDRAAALDVVDKLQAVGLYVTINTTCDAGLYDVNVMDGVHFKSLGCAVFKPFALGVCLAAREAVERRDMTA